MQLPNVQLQLRTAAAELGGAVAGRGPMHMPSPTLQLPGLPMQLPNSAMQLPGGPKQLHNPALHMPNVPMQPAHSETQLPMVQMQFPIRSCSCRSRRGNCPTRR